MEAVPTTQPHGSVPPPVQYSRFDIPILHKRDRVPNAGMKVDMHLMHQRSATFDTDDRAQVDMTIAKNVGELLHSQFPGHFWEVEVDTRAGHCLIGLSVLLGNWRHLIALNGMTMGKVVRAGGEILERFDIPRSKIDVAAFCEARKHRVSRYNQKPPGGV